MKPNPSLVSVVVPARNSARTIEACLQSIRSQTHHLVELVVIDNGSTDRTPEIARRYADVFDSAGPERSAQRNRGARMSSGTFLLFIDADMVLDSTVVSECVDLAQTTKAPGIVIPEVSVGEGFVARCRAFERSCYLGDASIEAARFFSRHAFEQCGGFDENLTGPEDWDLTARIGTVPMLPRTRAFITHNEGRLKLSQDLAKKKYYAASFLRYWQKHNRSEISQGNLVFRAAFFRNWRRFARHPILGVGVLTLKSLESVAALSGIAQALISRQENPQATRAK